MLLKKDAREGENALFSFGFFADVGAPLIGTTTFSYILILILILML